MGLKMNKTFVAELNNHNVYLISDINTSFYINVLKTKESTNITLDINAKKKESINDIIGYYEKIDNYNITLVVPLIKVSEDFDEFKRQSNIISKLINNSYKLLTTNGINVKDNINVIKHRSRRSDFIDFFLKQFSSRLRYISIDDLVHEEVPYNKINAANMSFVIGKPELDLTIKDDELEKIINETQEKRVKKSTPKFSFATSGYISYYLLGFLTAVVTLLILTLLIK